MPRFCQSTCSWSWDEVPPLSPQATLSFDLEAREFAISQATSDHISRTVDALSTSTLLITPPHEVTLSVRANRPPVVTMMTSSTMLTRALAGGRICLLSRSIHCRLTRPGIAFGRFGRNPSSIANRYRWFS